MALATAEVGMTKASQAKWKKGAESGQKLAAGDEAVIPAGVEPEWNSAVAVSALRCEGAYGLKGTGTIAIAGGSPSGTTVLSLPPTAGTFTWKGEIELESPSTERLKIFLGGHEPQTITFQAGKYILEEAVKSGLSFRVNKKADVQFNGQEVTPGASGFIEFTEEAVVDVKGSTLKSGESGGVTIASTATITDNASTTYIMRGAANTNKFMLNAHKLKGKLEVLGAHEIGGGGEVGIFAVNNKGAAAGKGARITQGTTLTVPVLTTNGTVGTPSRLESTEAAKAATLAIAEQETTGGILIKDITVPVGIWYVPEATDEGGNSTFGTTIRKAAKGVAGAIIGSAVLKFADQGPLAGTGGLKAVSTLKFADPGTIVGRAGLAAVSTLRFVSTGAWSGKAAAVGAAILRFSDTGPLGGRGGLKGTSTLKLPASSSWAASGALRGLATLGFPDTAPLKAKAAAVGSSTVRMIHTAPLAGRGGLRGESKLRFVDSGTILVINVGKLVGSAVLRFPMSGSTFVPKWVGKVLGSVAPTGKIDVVIVPASSVTTSVTAVGTIDTEIEAA